MAFFSIIVPVYMVEKYIYECVESILSQTFDDYECILVDDNSPDNCPVICDEYANKNKTIKVIHKNNGGLSDARNVGIQESNGKYIIFIDSDDKITDNNALKHLYNFIQINRTDVIVNVNWHTFTDNGEIELFDRYNKSMVIATPEEVIAGFDNSFMYIAGCWFVLSKEYIIMKGLYFKKGIYHEDEHWIPRVLFNTQQIAINHYPFYAYRVKREGSITSSITPKRLFDMLSITDDLFEWSKDKNTYSKNGCSFMLTKAKGLLHSVLLGREEIKNKYKKDYHSLKFDIIKRFGKTPSLFFDLKLLLYMILGTSITEKLIQWKQFK